MYLYNLNQNLLEHKPKLYQYIVKMMLSTMLQLRSNFHYATYFRQ